MSKSALNQQPTQSHPRVTSGQRARVFGILTRHDSLLSVITDAAGLLVEHGDPVAAGDLLAAYAGPEAAAEALAVLIGGEVPAPRSATARNRAVDSAAVERPTVSNEPVEHPDWCTSCLVEHDIDGSLTGFHQGGARHITSTPEPGTYVPVKTAVCRSQWPGAAPMVDLAVDTPGMWGTLWLTPDAAIRLGRALVDAGEAQEFA